MKKIIATVLAMVMALALCTTAFADAPISKTETIPNETAYVKVVDNAADDGITVAPHYAKTGVDLNTAYDVYVKSGSDHVLATDSMAEKYRAGYKTLNLAPYATAVSATCADAGYKVALYQDKTGAYYAKKADVTAFNDANPNNKIDLTGTTVVFIGAKFENVEAFYTITEAAVKTSAGHILYKTSEVWGKNDVTVYACAICGGKYIVKDSSIHSDDAVDSLAKISYGPFTQPEKASAKAVLNGKGIDVNKAFTPENATVMYTLSAGTTTPSTGTTTKPSPKTFDAGIAMYVGMALTSVAGSAVVIGKKKEF